MFYPIMGVRRVLTKYLFTRIASIYCGFRLSDVAQDIDVVVVVVDVAAIAFAAMVIGAIALLCVFGSVLVKVVVATNGSYILCGRVGCGQWW